MMKRLLALALCLCFVLGGCAQNAAPEPAADGGAAQDTQKTPAEPESADAAEQTVVSGAYTVDLPVPLAGGCPARRWDGDGWYLYVPIQGWSEASSGGTARWLSACGTGSTISIREASREELQAERPQLAEGQAERFAEAADGRIWLIWTQYDPALLIHSDLTGLEPTVLEAMAESFTFVSDTNADAPAVSPGVAGEPSGLTEQDKVPTPFERYTRRTIRQLTAGMTEENVAYSPANLYLALCMLAETTGGESRAQILDLLGLDGIEQAQNTANTLWNELRRDSETGRTLLANSIWLNAFDRFHEDTVVTLANVHHAAAFSVPMGDPATDDAIHEWINENTNHLLEEAAGKLETHPDDLAWLISTLYFKGTWYKQFDANLTREDTFTAANGAEQKADFMHGTRNGMFYRGENYAAASLPFCDDLSMWFLLPDEGVSLSDVSDPLALLTELSSPDFDPSAYGVGQSHAEIRWSVPKFDVDSVIDLISELEALGVTDIFDGCADFSPLIDGSAYVRKAEHAARVMVNEEGCEAAAYTVFALYKGMEQPQPPVEMNLNRPFAFLITGADGLPLFVGLVNTME